MGEDKWLVLEILVENKEEVFLFSYILEFYIIFGLLILIGISEIECVGGIYLGEENKVVEGFIVYDKLSGIYFGEDKGFVWKILVDEVSEGGILL